MTSHDCLGEHITRTGVLDINVCPICKSGIMNSDPLLDCTRPDRVAEEQGDHLTLNRKARDLMDLLWMPAFSLFLDPYDCLLHFYSSLIVL
ncbi:hypothetical protein NPIL_83881 [Nephila pilipes]|uniref:Uncharacterized protein n=1 Tax=Nephila pilipes TaxID=299642 RepID=A0A8X6QIT0_NEPPI|nr:hypothetical protein NPIL_83881 [Nephila pilipes]